MEAQQSVGQADLVGADFGNATPPGRPVVVCTAARGVFFGYAVDTAEDRIVLKQARNAYYWSAATGGVLGLGAIGPQAGSKIGKPADIELRGITCVIECTSEAAQAWEGAAWG